MEKIAVEKGSMMMMKLNPAGEKNVGALSRTYEILEDFIYETPEPHHITVVNPKAELICSPTDGESLYIGHVRNLNTLKVGELIWTSGKEFTVKILTDSEDTETIKDMSYIFMVQNEIMGDADIDPVFMQPGKDGFLVRLASMFGEDPNDIAALNRIGSNIIETNVKYYGLLRHLYHTQQLKPWLTKWIESEIDSMRLNGMWSVVNYLHDRLEFPYSSSQIVKALYGDSSDDHDELLKEA